MPKSLLSARHVKDVPQLVGVYEADQGGEIRVLAKDSLSDNSFVVYPPSKKSPLTVTVQRLDEKGNKYIIQAQPEGGRGVLLTVGEIDLPKITIYFFPKAKDEILALAKKRDVTVNNDGLITEYKSIPGIIGLFRDLFAVRDKETMVLTRKKK
jgi:hypothetical protein